MPSSTRRPAPRWRSGPGRKRTGPWSKWPIAALGSLLSRSTARLSRRTMNASLLKRLIVGKPMPLAQARHERLSKTVALAVFSSDALSSVAYATEEILLVLVLAGAAAAHLLVPIS